MQPNFINLTSFMSFTPCTLNPSSHFKIPINNSTFLIPHSKSISNVYSIPPKAFHSKKLITSSLRFQENSNRLLSNNLKPVSRLALNQNDGLRILSSKFSFSFPIRENNATDFAFKPRLGGRRGLITTVPAVGRNNSIQNAPENNQSNMDLTIFRFTLGIPGFDDANIPFIISLLISFSIILNHLLSSEVISPAQMRSEILGLFLSSACAILPSIGKILDGRDRQGKDTMDLTKRQIFVLEKSLHETQKKELAFLSYSILKNTNASSVIICYNGNILCVRGFWENFLEKNSDFSSLIFFFNDFFKTFSEKSEKVKNVLNGNIDTLYITKSSSEWSEWKSMVPNDSQTLLIQSIKNRRSQGQSQTSFDFVVLVSNESRAAFSEKDLFWISSMMNKIDSVFS